MSKRREQEEFLYMRTVNDNTVQLVRVGQRYILSVVNSEMRVTTSVVDPTISVKPMIPAKPNG